MSSSGQQQYEMGYTEAEFSRVLHGDFSGAKSDFSCTDQGPCHWLITDKTSDLRINISVSSLPPRTLGAISLPRIQVTFDVSTLDTLRSDYFFDKFFKYFHKGGG